MSNASCVDLKTLMFVVYHKAMNSRVSLPPYGCTSFHMKAWNVYVGLKALMHTHNSLRKKRVKERKKKEKNKQAKNWESIWSTSIDVFELITGLVCA